MITLVEIVKQVTLVDVGILMCALLGTFKANVLQPVPIVEKILDVALGVVVGVVVGLNFKASEVFYLPYLTALTGALVGSNATEALVQITPKEIKDFITKRFNK